MIEASHFDANDRLRRGRAPSARGLRAVHLPHARRRQDVADDHRRDCRAGVYVQTVKEDPERRGLLVCRHRARRLRLVRRRRHVAVAAAEPAADSMRDLAFHGQRSDRRDARPRLLGARRHQRAAADRRGVAAADAHPVQAGRRVRSCRRASEHGTPLQKDEPQAENPPAGAIIDYYLKSAATRAGDASRSSTAAAATVRRFASDDPVRRSIRTRSRSTPSGSAPQEPPSAAAGMHRFVWDLRPDHRQRPRPRRRGGGGGGGGGGRGGPPPVAPGNYLREADGERPELHAAAHGEARSAGSVSKAKT